MEAVIYYNLFAKFSVQSWRKNLFPCYVEDDFVINR